MAEQPNRPRIERSGWGWSVVDGSGEVGLFDRREDAERVLRVVCEAWEKAQKESR